MTEQQQAVTEIVVGLIALSNFNPRSKQSDGHAELADLAASITKSGVTQPILVRPLKEPSRAAIYELVYGARRLEASKMAGKATIPAIVRELTDQEARELAVIENLQRKDLHFMDEARGLKELLATGKSVEQVGDQIGKPAVYVCQRLALTNLIAKAEALAFKGKLPLRAALKLARLTPAIQQSVLKAAGSERERDEVISSSQVDEILDSYVYRDIKKAPFDSESRTLCEAAGPCSECPKRTGANRLLFADIKEPDVCTDIECWDRKAAATVELKLAEHPGSIKIATQRASYSEKQQAKKDGVMLEDYFDESGWKASSKGACEFTKEGLVVVGPDAGQIRLICAEKKCPIHRSRSEAAGERARPGVMSEEKKRQIESLWQRRTGHAVRRALHAAMREVQAKLEIMPLEALRLAVRHARSSAKLWSDPKEYLWTTWGLDDKSEMKNDRYVDALDKLITGADEKTLLAVLLDLPLCQDIEDKFGGGEDIEVAAKAYGVPVGEIKRKITGEWNAKKKVSYEKREARLAKERERAKKPAAPKKEKKQKAKKAALKKEQKKVDAEVAKIKKGAAKA
jgi:ParB family chromosome partitioning protein